MLNSDLNIFCSIIADVSRMLFFSALRCFSTTPSRVASFFRRRRTKEASEPANENEKEKEIDAELERFIHVDKSETEKTDDKKRPINIVVVGKYADWDLA